MIIYIELNKYEEYLNSSLYTILFFYDRKNAGNVYLREIISNIENKYDKVHCLMIDWFHYKTIFKEKEIINSMVVFSLGNGSLEVILKKPKIDNLNTTFNFFQSLNITILNKISIEKSKRDLKIINLNPAFSPKTNFKNSDFCSQMHYNNKTDILVLNDSTFYNKYNYELDDHKYFKEIQNMNSSKVLSKEFNKFHSTQSNNSKICSSPRKKRISKNKNKLEIPESNIDLLKRQYINLYDFKLNIKDKVFVNLKNQDLKSSQTEKTSRSYRSLIFKSKSNIPKRKISSEEFYSGNLNVIKK